jgi:hypothetical protein
MDRLRRIVQPAEARESPVGVRPKTGVWKRSVLANTREAIRGSDCPITLRMLELGISGEAQPGRASDTVRDGHAERRLVTWRNGLTAASLLS